MSETTMTPEDGSGTLTVGQAANAFEGLMNTPANSQEESEGVEQEPVEAEAPEAEPQEEVEEVEATEEEQEDTETEEEEQPRYKVKAAGEEKEVTLDELVKGYQLGADYTKKTTEVAEQRKAVEAERQAIEEANYAGFLFAQRFNARAKLILEHVPHA